MIEIKRTNSSNKDFQDLVKKLDQYLAVCDGDEHDFYDQFNKLDNLNNVVLLYLDGIPAGCGAYKEYSPGIAEIKRMYVDPQFRNNGYASAILNQLEIWARENNYKKCILETGKRQLEAIEFYKKCGYQVIDNYEPYKNMKNSICFQMDLINFSK